MAMNVASTLATLFEDCQAVTELVGLGPDVEAAKTAVHLVETAEDLFKIFRTDVNAGDVSILNLLSIMDAKLLELQTKATHCRTMIQNVNASPGTVSLKSYMQAHNKGSTNVNLFKPSFTSEDLTKALEEFHTAAADNIKPKIISAQKMGKGKRCIRMGRICGPITRNPKNYSDEVVETARHLIKIMQNI